MKESYYRQKRNHYSKNPQHHLHNPSLYNNSTPSWSISRTLLIYKKPPRNAVQKPFFEPVKDRWGIRILLKTSSDNKACTPQQIHQPRFRNVGSKKLNFYTNTTGKQNFLFNFNPSTKPPTPQGLCHGTGCFKFWCFQHLSRGFGSSCQCGFCHSGCFPQPSV